MPTQIPSGSPLAVRGPHRSRARKRRPKLLADAKRFARGGMVDGDELEKLEKDTEEELAKPPKEGEEEKDDGGLFKLAALFA